MYLKFSVYACLQDANNSPCGSAWWGKGERERGGERNDGGGKRYPRSYLVHRITRRSHFPLSEALLCPLISFALLVVLQKPATELWCLPSLLRPSGAPLLPWLARPREGGEGEGGGGAEWRRLILPTHSKGRLALIWHLVLLSTSLRNWPWHCLATAATIN